MKQFLLAAVPGKTTPEMLEEALQDVSTLKWYIVPLFVFAFYIFISEVKRKNYNLVFGAAAFWLMDVLNETWNTIVYACTGQPVWGTTAQGGSALQLLIGYNIEISFMFAVLGIAACKMIKVSAGAEGASFWEGNKNWASDPNNMYYKANVRYSTLTAEEKKIKTKAIVGRIAPALIGSILAVIIEMFLNHCNLLTWEKSWWQTQAPIILFLIGYCPFYFTAYVVHDLPRKWQLIALSIIAGVVLLLLIITGCLGILGPQISTGWRWRS